MRVLHFDCFSGISGDMTLAALIDAGVDVAVIRRGLDSLGLPIQMEVAKVRKGGFAATQVRIEAPEETSHRFLPEVEEILERGQLTPRQRELAKTIFRRLAEAEARAHGLPLERVHFHEVGALDSIADIVGSAIALDLLGAERITSGPVVTGSGTVQCAHGLMPIPAPGTAELLRGVPLRSTNIKGELTTPTGAAILTSIVNEWVDAPALIIEQIGHGAGRKELVEQPNLLRIFVGQAASPVKASPERQPGEVSPGSDRDFIWLLETNLDDVPGEIIGYCFERLLAAGAVDVFTVPIQMKKNRPGVLLSVLAPPAALAAVEEVLFGETATFGIRRVLMERDKLQRRPTTVSTPWGDIQGKLGWREGRPLIFTPEYEDCARVARQHGVPLREVYEATRRAYSTSPGSG